METLMTSKVNYADFKATCSEVQIVKTDKVHYKFVQMFGPKTLCYWVDTDRISTRIGHNPPQTK